MDVKPSTKEMSIVLGQTEVKDEDGELQDSSFLSCLIWNATHTHTHFYSAVMVTILWNAYPISCSYGHACLNTSRSHKAFYFGRVKQVFPCLRFADNAPGDDDKVTESYNFR